MQHCKGLSSSTSFSLLLRNVPDLSRPLAHHPDGWGEIIDDEALIVGHTGNSNRNVSKRRDRGQMKEERHLHRHLESRSAYSPQHHWTLALIWSWCGTDVDCCQDWPCAPAELKKSLLSSSEVDVNWAGAFPFFTSLIRREAWRRFSEPSGPPLLFVRQLGGRDCRQIAIQNVPVTE